MEKLYALKQLLVESLRLLYDAEKMLCDSLPLLKAKAYSMNVKDFLDEEIKEKKKQHQRVEGVLAVLKENPEGVTSDVAQYLNNVRTDLIEQCNTPELSDMILVKLNRAITIYLMSLYQQSITYSVELGYDMITRILRRSLQREKDIDQRLQVLEAYYSKLCNEEVVP
jgi:ferritin-like metal-binding protein YciE